MIRLIISDIDGTLVKEGSTEINPEYMEVIRQLTDHGVVFAAASGRHSSSIDAVFHEVRNRIFYLSDNGSCIQKYGKPCHELRLNTENLKAYLRDALEGGDCYPLLSTAEGFFTDEKDEAFANLIFGQYKGAGGIVENLQDYLPEGVKLSLYCLDDVKKVYARMSANWKEKFAIDISGEKWVDINDPEATKGNAVRWIQKELGIRKEETVVFGDNFNDMSMLACGDRSYASVLSAPEVKQAARYEVASYEEDGVLQVLKEILQEVAHEK